MLENVRSDYECSVCPTFPFSTARGRTPRVRLNTTGAPDVAFTCKSWWKTAGGTNKDSHFSGEVSTSSSRAQNRATLVYYLPMLRGHAPLTLPIFPAVQKWISRPWILPPAVVAPGDFQGSKRDLKEALDEMTRYIDRR